jgi:Mg2+/Co2+ transporter CorB
MTWVVIALCLLVSFVFSGIEAGILSVNRVRLKHRVKLRDRAALILELLLERPERILVTVLVVTNLMNIFAITLAASELIARFGTRGYWITLIAFLPVYLLGVELLPKSLFRKFPYRALAMLAGPSPLRRPSAHASALPRREPHTALPRK